MADPNTTDGRSVEGGSAKPVQVMNMALEVIKNAVTSGVGVLSRIDVITKTPTVYNVTLTLANTEYSQGLPVNCRGFEFQARTGVDIRYAFVTGKVATPTAPYMTLKSNGYYFSFPVSQGATPETLYFASATAGTVVEIIAWV